MAKNLIPIRLHRSHGIADFVVAVRPTNLVLASVLFDVVEVVSRLFHPKIPPNVLHRGSWRLSELLEMDEMQLVAVAACGIG